MPDSRGNVVPHMLTVADVGSRSNGRLGGVYQPVLKEPGNSLSLRRDWSPFLRSLKSSGQPFLNEKLGVVLKLVDHVGVRVHREAYLGVSQNLHHDTRMDALRQ